MKRQQRHHLKENELAQTIAAAREYIEPRTKQIGYLITGAIAIGVVVLGVLFFQRQSNVAADAKLAEAMVALNARVVPSRDPETAALPASAQFESTGTFATEEQKLKAALPKLQAAADEFPDKQAGVIARYHLAGALAALGRNDEAVKQFDQVVQRTDSDTLYGRMARLGKADSQARAGQLDAAITSWKELIDQKNAEIPVDAILMELARAYQAKGNKEEARKTFSQIVEQHPTSPYSAEARTELETLKS